MFPFGAFHLQDPEELKWSHIIKGKRALGRLSRNAGGVGFVLVLDSVYESATDCCPFEDKNLQDMQYETQGTSCAKKDIM